MKDTLASLRKKAVIGFVGGSDISKQYEQLGESSKLNQNIHCSLLGSEYCFSFCFKVLQDFDFCFAENGLTAYRLGKQMASQVSLKDERHVLRSGI